MHRNRQGFSALLAIFSLIGCQGDIGSVGVNEPSTGPDLVPTEPRADATPDVAWAPAALLTSAQYRYAIEDLLGVVTDAPLPAENRTDFYVNNAHSHIASELLEEQRSLLVEDLVAGMDEPSLRSALGCETCDAEELAPFFRRAMRRPVTEAESDMLISVVEAGETQEEGLRMMLEVVLRSPQFLYRFEGGESDGDGELVEASSYTVASRLSFFLWHSGPDDTLLDLAESDALQDDETLEAQVQRLMEDERFERTLAAFHSQWLDLERLDGVVKTGEEYELFAAAGPSWRRSLDAYILESFDAGLDSLLTSTSYPLTADLAEAYGLDPEGDLATYEFDGATHAGLLTHPALMAKLAYGDQASPIHRGVYVLRSLLCTELPAPPEGIDLSPPPVDPDSTSRERFDALTSSDECAGCHQRFNPIGFLFSHFDAAGRYVEESASGRALDSAATVIDSNVGGDYEGAADFAAALADSSAVRDCVAGHWLRYALGRPVNAHDERTVYDSRAAFEESAGDFRALMRSIAVAPGFRLYRATEGARP